MKTYRQLLFFLGLILCSSLAFAQEKAYLFSYFVGQSDGLHLAYSTDGLKWTALNDNQSILRPVIGKDRLMRDPSICQGPDGTFHLVWTSSWTDRIIGHASSTDLIHWSVQDSIPVMMHEPTAKNCWAPEVFYDQHTRRYWIFWATTIPDAKGIKTEGCLSESGDNHRIYCTTTRDWKKFSKTRLWFNPDFNAIDAAVVKSPINGELIMAVKNENLEPYEKNIRVTRSRRMRSFSTDVSPRIHAQDRGEGPAPLFVGDTLFVYYDIYGMHRYGLAASYDNGHTWVDRSADLEMPKGIRHGTAFTVDREVLDRLIREYGSQNCINYGTFNIRYADGDRGTKRDWKYRRGNVGDFIKSQNLSIVGCQEVLHEQLLDLRRMLPEYDYEGVGRDDGATQGEYSPIFWKRDEWERVNGGTFWLSETPHQVGSVGWDAALPRIATWVLLKNRVSQRQLMCINTHFDHVGKKARVEAGKLIQKMARQIAGDLPLVLTGDFNVGMESNVYLSITHNNDFPMLDTFMEGAPHFGAYNTFHSFSRQKKEDCGKIDFIFATPNVHVLSTMIPEEDRSENPKHLSDHNPVVARIIIP